MAKVSLKKVASVMKSLDLCMFTTTTARGMTASRPMSNNAEVDFDGSCYFFSWEKSHLVKDIKKNPKVNLSYVGTKMLQKVFVSLSGKAKLIKDKEQMREHWSKDLEIWFKDGIDTKGVVMIEVDAKHVKYWHGLEQGELSIHH